jgi:hypothetical protein
MVQTSILYRENLAGTSYRELAEKYELSEDSIRGRISKYKRARNTRIDVYEELLNVPIKDIYVKKQEELVQHCKEQYNYNNPNGTLMFLTDVHFPYADYPALELTYLLAEKVQPTHVTSTSDLFDFEQYSRWENTPTLASQMWESSINNGLNVSAHHHKILKDISNPVLLDIRGNHDNWLFQYLRNNKNGYEERNVLDFMESLVEQGVLLFSNASKQRSLVRWNDYVLIHGASTGSNMAIGKYASQLSNGLDTISGHVHRTFNQSTFTQTHYNVGCLCDSEKMPYLYHKPSWDLGVLVATKNTIENIKYKEQRGRLYAYWRDTELSVPYKRKWEVIL